MVEGRPPLVVPASIIKSTVSNIDLSILLMFEVFSLPEMFALVLVIDEFMFLSIMLITFNPECLQATVPVPAVIALLKLSAALNTRVNGSRPELGC